MTSNGEMANLIRKTDWDNTALGPMQEWPASLKILLNSMLNSKYPKFLWWGSQLTCFYNDAYRPSLGNEGKHPLILGMNAEDAWPEIWSVIKPLIDQVMSGGEATWFEDQLIPIFRNNRIEDVYWTFSYSAVTDEEGIIKGVLVTCNETTEKVLTKNVLEDRNEQLEFAINSAELGTWDYNPATNKFSANHTAKEWFGLEESQEADLSEAMKVIIEQDRDRVLNSINEVLEYESGGNYDIEYTIQNPNNRKEITLRAVGKVWFNQEKNAVRFTGILQNITEKVKYRLQIEDSERTLKQIIHQAPVAIAILKCKEFVISIANSRFLELWGRKENEIIDLPLKNALSHLNTPEIVSLLNDVLQKGKSAKVIEMPVEFVRDGNIIAAYIDFTFEPMFNADGIINGIIAVGGDVTDQVNARKQMELNEQRIRNFVLNAPFPIGVYTGREMKIQFANQAILDVWGKGNDVIGKTYMELLPELASQHVYEQLDEVYTTGKPFHAKNQPIELMIDGKMRLFYFNYSFTALYEADGSIYGVMNTADDVTDLAIAKKNLEESEEKLNIVLETSGHGSWEIDLVNNKIAYSEKYLEVLGLEKGQKLKHIDLVSRIHPDDLQLRNKSMEDVLKTGNLAYQARSIWPDGSIHWFEAKGKAYFDENNKPLKLLGTVKDITTEKSYQQNLEEREARFSLLANSMPHLVWVTDENGNVIFYNNRITEFEGAVQMPSGNWKWESMIHRADLDYTIKTWELAFKNLTEYKAEHRIKMKNGDYRWFLSRGYPYKDKDGNLINWFGTATDINDIKVLEKRKDEFIKMASHELKTPITSIKGYLQLLQEQYSNTEDPVMQRSLQTLDKQINKLTSLISGLLDVTRIETGGLTLNKKRFCLDDLIKETITDLLNVNPGYKIIFKDLSHETVLADEERITQVVVNLLSNAIKYSPENNEIIVSMKRENGQLVTAIKDFGVGIEESEQEKIFENFYRVQGRDEQTFPGFGIGLYVVSEILKGHNGEIWVESEKNKGSVFYFSLPVYKENN